MKRLIVLFALGLLSFTSAEAKDSGLQECQNLQTKVQKYECLVSVVRKSGYDYSFDDFDDPDPFWAGHWTLGDWYVIGKPLGGKTVGTIYASNGVKSHYDPGTPMVKFRCTQTSAALGIGARETELRERNGKTNFLTWFDGAGPIESKGVRDQGKQGVWLTVKGISELADYLEKLIAATDVIFEFDTIKHGRKTLQLKTGALRLAFFAVLIECPK